VNTGSLSPFLMPFALISEIRRQCPPPLRLTSGYIGRLRSLSKKFSTSPPLGVFYLLCAKIPVPASYHSAARG